MAWFRPERPIYIVIFLALVSFGWFGMARLVRGQVLYLKQTQFVEAAQAIGASTPRILFNHLLAKRDQPDCRVGIHGYGGYGRY